MLDAYIIDELKRNEQRERQREDDQRPRLELPLFEESIIPEVPENGTGGTVIYIDMG